MSVVKNSRGGGGATVLVAPFDPTARTKPIPREIKLAKWGPGPWVDEPDSQAGTKDGIRWLLLRDDELGHWCGYVHVPDGHPWHGAGCREIRVDVHGGVTVAGAVEPGSWWLGFDCCHVRDYVPARPNVMAKIRAVAPKLAADVERLRSADPVDYRDHSYALSEVVDLAEQVAAASRAR